MEKTDSRYLYVIWSPEYIGTMDMGPCKVGITSNLKSRLSTLSTGSPKPLEIYEYWDFAGQPISARAIERLFHKRNAAERLHGEWFDHPPDIARTLIELYTRAEIARSRPCRKESAWSAASLAAIRNPIPLPDLISHRDWMNQYGFLDGTHPQH